MRVLIADDDPTARSILSTLFKKLGHQPTTVEDGQKAVEAALQDPHPEIILLDWMMPKLSGPEVAKKIREEHKRIPFRPYILILSSKSDRKEVAKALNDGADDFLSKPPDGAELLARLRVAERMVAHEIELRETIAELTKMIERNELLGELVARHHPRAVANSIIHNNETQSFITATFREFNTPLTPIDRADEVKFQNPFCVWDAVLIPQQDAWIDIVLEMGEATIEYTFEQALHRPPTAKENETFITEAHTLIRRMIQADFQKQNIGTIAPYGTILKKAEYAGNPQNSVTQAHLFTSNGGPIRVTISRSLTPRTEKDPALVKVLEFLPLGFPHNSSTPIVNHDTVVDKTIRHKISHFAAESIDRQTAVVMLPTETTRWFHHGSE